jgi:ElaB/YqjD/DUF883 family membrane-anchored ribosome-binding protein
MDDIDPKPISDGDITPAPAEIGFTPAEPLKDQGVDFTPADEAQSGSRNSQASTTDAFKSGAQRLTGQAQDQVRGLADQGKERMTGMIDQLAQMLTDAAGQVDEKLGGRYGDYARQAADHVAGFSSQVRDKDVDQLLDDVRGAIRKSPGVALGVSAALGFVVARLVSSGLEQRETV